MLQRFETNNPPVKGGADPEVQTLYFDPTKVAGLAHQDGFKSGNVLLEGGGVIPFHANSVTVVNALAEQVIEAQKLALAAAEEKVDGHAARLAKAG